MKRSHSTNREHALAKKVHNRTGSTYGKHILYIFRPKAAAAPALANISSK
jgi:hypothetical protein